MKKLLFFVCAIFAFVACTQIVIEEEQGVVIDAPVTLTVGFEDGNDTRIQLNEAQKTVWNKEDLVSVFYRSDANQKWQYQGETGERVGNLKRVENAVGTTKTTKTVVVYPYSESYWLNTDSYAIEATLPATQYYAEGSYGVGSNLMVSQSEFTQFSLKSVCGWLKLQLTGNGELVKSIKFRGNNEEQVAGLIYVDTATAEATLASEMGNADDNNAGGNLIFDDTVITELTLDCGEGVTLGEEVTTFYLSLPPQTFANGFTVDIESKSNETLTLSTTNELVIERNMIQPMATIEPEFVKQYKPTNNEIWYTNGSTTEATTPHETDVFGANIVSNTYSAESECWIITFDGDVTTIGDLAFYGCSSLTNIAIPNNVATIGSRAFYGCNSLIGFKGKFASTDGRCLIVDETLLAFAPAGLTEYTIPNSVTTIEDYAFYDCSSLTSITISDSVNTIGYRAFYGCSSLTKMTIGKGVTSIESEAFYDCTGELIVNCNSSFTISMNSHGAFYGSDFTSVTIGDGVTSIGDKAFVFCYHVTSVTIPDSVTSIGSSAFSNCSSLTSITIPDSVTSIGSSAFNKCSSLTSINIPDGVASIGNYTFQDCSSLTSVTIPDSVTKIGDYTFYGCSNLTSVYYNGDLSDWCNIDFYSFYSNPLKNGAKLYINNTEVTEVTIPSDISVIKDYTFYGCSSLTSVTIPDSVTSIGDYAFYNCSSLTSITIPDSVTSIGDYAFYYCSSLTSITIPDSVTSIGDKAFYGCSSLTSVTIGSGVTSIGSSAFNGCSSLTNMTIGKGVTLIGGRAFSGCTGELIVNCNIPSASSSSSAAFYNSKFTKVTIGDAVTSIGDYAFYDCSSLTSITIPDSVTSIGQEAFAGCTGELIVNCNIPSASYYDQGAFYNSKFTKVTIGDSVTSIGDYAFWDCSSLTNVTIPDSVTSIGDYTFYNCSSLKSVTIPDSVTSIGNAAFYNCSSLTSVDCKATTPPTGGSNMFSYWDEDEYEFIVIGCKIYVPTESVDAYKAASGWSTYKNYIVGYNFK